MWFLLPILLYLFHPVLEAIDNWIRLKGKVLKLLISFFS